MQELRLTSLREIAALTSTPAELSAFLIRQPTTFPILLPIPRRSFQTVGAVLSSYQIERTVDDQEIKKGYKFH